MQQEYNLPVLSQLSDQQVRFAPREKKLEQIESAERLISEIDPERPYPYEYVCYRITGYRPEAHAGVKLNGQELLHDLRLLVEDLSDAANLEAETMGEQVLT